MKFGICMFAVLCAAIKGHAAAISPDVGKVKFEISRISNNTGTLHWKITNGSDEGVYLYSFFVLGPAYNIERSSGKAVFDTTPIAQAPSCPPNRVAPLLLFFIRSGGRIEGDFVDAELQRAGGSEVSLKIAVGSEPSGVIKEANRFAHSNCKHSPYDAVVNWATFMESNRIRLPQ